jgi:hypothetical protein
MYIEGILESPDTLRKSKPHYLAVVVGSEESPKTEWFWTGWEYRANNFLGTYKYKS